MDSLIPEIETFTLIHPTCIFTTRHQLEQRRLVADQPPLLFLDLDQIDHFPDVDNEIDHEIFFSFNPKNIQLQQQFNNNTVNNQQQNNNTNNNNNVDIITENNNNNNCTQQESILDKKRKRSIYEDDEIILINSDNNINNNSNNNNNNNNDNCDNCCSSSDDEKSSEQKAPELIGEKEDYDTIFRRIKLQRKEYIHVPSIKRGFNNNNNQNNNSNSNHFNLSQKRSPSHLLLIEKTMQENVFRLIPPMDGIIG